MAAKIQEFGLVMLTAGAFATVLHFVLPVW